MYSTNCSSHKKLYSSYSLYKPKISLLDVFTGRRVPEDVLAAHLHVHLLVVVAHSVLQEQAKDLDHPNV